MCAPKSAIIFPGHSVFCPWDTNSHADMLKEKGIRDDNPYPNFVKVEIYPDDKNLYERDYTKWMLHEDQDRIPDWYDHDKSEAIMREYVADWHKARFIWDGEVVKEIRDGEWYMRGGTLQDMRGGTLRDMCGGTLRDMCGGTLRDMRGGTLQDMRGGTLQDMWGGTLRNMWGGTLQDMRGGTLQDMCGGTLQDMRGGTLQDMCGGTLRNMWGGLVVRGETIYVADASEYSLKSFSDKEDNA